MVFQFAGGRTSGFPPLCGDDVRCRGGRPGSRCRAEPWSVLSGTHPPPPGQNSRGSWRGARRPGFPSGRAAPFSLHTSSMCESQFLWLLPRRHVSPVGATCRFPVASMCVSLLAARGGISIINVPKHPPGRGCQRRGWSFHLFDSHRSFSRPRQPWEVCYVPPRPLRSERNKLFREHLGCFMLGF